MAVVAAAIVEALISLASEVVVGKICVDTVDTITTAAKTPKINRDKILLGVVCMKFILVVVPFELSR